MARLCAGPRARDAGGRGGGVGSRFRPRSARSAPSWSASGRPRLCPGRRGRPSRLPHPVDRTVALPPSSVLRHPHRTAVSSRPANHALALFDAFYRSGSLVFGGGHVVLPLLQAAVVPPGWVRTIVSCRLRRGAGCAGPALHVRGLSRHGHAAGAEWLARRVLCLVAIFLPSFLLVIGPLPFWNSFRRAPGRKPHCSASTPPLSACCWPRFITRSGPRASPMPTILRSGGGLFPAVMWQAPPWLVVAFCALVGAALALMPMGS